MLSKEKIIITNKFNIAPGGSKIGFKNYSTGKIPYISSGSSNNSIIGYVEPMNEDEITSSPAITVTAFCQARVQLWPFIARGNGGSAVKVLKPKKEMTLEELLWYASQINMQSWRYSYGIMISQARLKKMEIEEYNKKINILSITASINASYENAFRNIEEELEKNKSIEELS